MLLSISWIQVAFGVLILSAIPIALYLVIRTAVKGGRAPDR